MKDTNMYGCTPCPECGSKYRAPFLRNKGRLAPEGTVFLCCDDCGDAVIAEPPEGFRGARPSDKESK